MIINKTGINIVAIAAIMVGAGDALNAHGQMAPADQIVWSREAEALARQPAVAQVRLSPAPGNGGLGTGHMNMVSRTGSRTIETGVPLNNVFSYVLGLDQTMRNRVLLPVDEQQTKYDYLDTLPRGGREALQAQLKEQFGFVARRESRKMDALILRVGKSGAPGLQALSAASGGGGQRGLTGMKGTATMAFLAGELEASLGIPLINQTGLGGTFSYELAYPQGASTDEIKKAAFAQLGLSLIPAPNQTVEYVVVEKVK